MTKRFKNILNEIKNKQTNKLKPLREQEINEIKMKQKEN